MPWTSDDQRELEAAEAAAIARGARERDELAAERDRLRAALAIATDALTAMVRRPHSGTDCTPCDAQATLIAIDRAMGDAAGATVCGGCAWRGHANE